MEWNDLLRCRWMWHALADANSYRHLYGNSNSNSDGHGNGNSDCGAEVYADAQAATHATSTPISSSD